MTNEEFDPASDCKNWEGCQDEAYKQGYANAMNDLVKELKEIYICEFAMFSLCLIEETAERLRGKYDEQRSNKNT